MSQTKKIELSDVTGSREGERVKGMEDDDEEEEEIGLGDDDDDGDEDMVRVNVVDLFDSVNRLVG